MSHRTRRLRAVVVPAALLAMLAPALSAATSPGEAARATAAASLPVVDAPAVDGSPDGPDPYFPKDGNGGYQVTHYTIDDRYRPGTDHLAGRTTVTAVVGQDPLSSFHLDLRLTADAVTVNGAKATFSKPSGHELRVVPATTLAAGARFTVTVRYHGYPGTLRSATAWDGYFHEPGEVAAVGEPQIGPWWFAANETPRDKATFDITLRVPRGQQAVSNGRLVSRTVGEEWTAWRWRVSEPISTYMAMFVAGRFEVRRTNADGRPVWYAASRKLTRGERDASFRLLANTPRILRWMEARFGDYPYDATGGVMSSLFTGFALETATRPFYSYYGGPGPIRLVVHELAHQWFGDSVALELWRDTWLNEGFATYVEWLWEESNGRRTVDQTLHDTYAYRGGGFWNLRISDPGPDDIFSSPIYERGAMTLAALRCRLGKTEMRDLVRAWVDEHRGGTGTGTEFRALAQQRSGEDLTGFFSSWLDTTRKPGRTADNGLVGCD